MKRRIKSISIKKNARNYYSQPQFEMNVQTKYATNHGLMFDPEYDSSGAARVLVVHTTNQGCSYESDTSRLARFPAHEQNVDIARDRSRGTAGLSRVAIYC